MPVRSVGVSAVEAGDGVAPAVGGGLQTGRAGRPYRAGRQPPGPDSSQSSPASQRSAVKIRE